MRVRTALALGLTLLLSSLLNAAELAQRGILICVSENASGPVRQAALALVETAREVPALRALLTTNGSAGEVRLVASETLMVRDKRHSERFEKTAFELAAYNHLVVVGLRDTDPLMKQVWDVTASLDETARTLTMEGYGVLQGDIGYVESSRNPFLHSHQVRSATFDTCLFRLSGTSEAGVLAAVDAFRKGLNNGLVPAGPLTRPEPTILDLDPQIDPCPLPLPASVTVTDHDDQPGAALLAGWTQAAADEYRAYLEHAEQEPTRVWRMKYLRPRNFDRIHPQVWTCSYHRKAWGHAVTVARFADSAAAQAMVKSAFAEKRNWKEITLAGVTMWQTSQPQDEVFQSSFGSIYAGVVGECVILSGLPAEATAAVLKEIAAR